MSAPFIIAWAGVGVFVGAAVAIYSQGHVMSAQSRPRAARLITTSLTALAFGGLAWRFGYQFDLLPYSVLAGVGVTLGMIDVIEHRLPSVLVYSGVVLIGVLLTASAILDSRQSDLLRAVAGMAIIAVLYLVLALTSNGGLGAGDVKLGGLLGLTLGWQSWSAVITATFLGWSTAVLAWLMLRTIRRRPQSAPLPMGPFLLLAALLTIAVVPT